MRTLRRHRLFRLFLLAILCGLLLPETLPAQFNSGARRGRGAAQMAGPRNYRSRNFLVHTDLPPKEAQALLKRLETMLSIISKYWGQPNRKIIECYVVDDLNNWPRNVLPPEGRAKIQEGAGVTLGVTSVQSSILGTRAENTSVVYAVAEHGTPLHEAVHAYCLQNFASTGPTWYSEGMAEMGAYWRVDDSSVKLPEGVLKYLQESDPKPLSAIVDNTDQTGDSWQNYAWRWALCHLLANNTNYAERFRPLGLRLIKNRGASFEQTYGAMAREIAFEYRFFLEHLENGLRADLISFNWNQKFLVPPEGRALKSDIKARAGWQPARARVEAGKTYQVTASGTWSIAEDGAELTADGKPAPGADSTDNGGEESESRPENAGRLMGVILDPTTMSLGEPFELGTESTFTAKTDGRLYLRCADGWGQLADNGGEVSVEVGVNTAME